MGKGWWANTCGVCDLICKCCHFQWWYSAAKVHSFDELSKHIIEQFKNSLSLNIAGYANEQKPTTALKEAELADEFVLTPKGLGLGSLVNVPWVNITTVANSLPV